MNLYLMGYRGSGKSTVGALLADRLGCPHRDTDELVESLAGKTIQQIFSVFGEPEFRRLETEVIRQFQPDQQLVVSLGGGAILAAENRERLRATGWMVWLQASAEALFARLGQDQSTPQRRPPLTSFGGLAEVQTLLQQREPIYAACADFTVDVEKKSPADIAEAIVHWWQVDRLNILNRSVENP